MHLGRLFVLSSLDFGVYSHKGRAFTGTNCSGQAKEINVWVNTCRDTAVPKTRSIRVPEYGGHRQRATFWAEQISAHCGFMWQNSNSNWWADGGSNKFKKGLCINLSGTCNAFSSVSA
ncbi:hypothetical protein N7533_008652 [Penicillium manginii]|uniref:uncharacterized protein n=1 Tax=Penicillium manginii TaxID=203109 RepID=UPI0025484FF2|nr:uncharacterized protein N7533_008652 [Penicillium manginii]KAJ5743782.1 hypothetical protein N7533_008652 [Penicillium manginii]